MNMKKFFKWFAALLLFLLVIYFAGPRPAKPDFGVPVPGLPSDLPGLEIMIAAEEQAVRRLKPDNEARIVWADSMNRTKTKVAILYLHGFSASQAEGEPVHREIARRFGANLYLSRLYEHGIDRGDSTMMFLNAGDYMASAEKALAVTKMLGEEVVVIGTSTGGAMALYLASKHPEIKALVLYSPAVKLYDPTAVILNKPWGLLIARKFMGGNTSTDKPESPEHARYWSLTYRVEALVALQNLLANTMKPSTFEAVKCPVFLGYYYKDEKEQDHTVSVPAMLSMFDQLGTPADKKAKQAFPGAGAHVIASYIRSNDWQGVENETVKFLTGILQ